MYTVLSYCWLRPLPSLVRCTMQMQLVSRRARALRLVRFIGLLCTTRQYARKQNTRGLTTG